MVSAYTNGKIFGKIDLIDLVLIVIILAIALLAATTFFKQKSWVFVELEVCNTDALLNVTNCDSSPQWLIGSIKTGDKMFEGSEEVAEILDVNVLPYNIANRNILVTANILATVNQNGEFEFGRGAVRVNDFVRITTATAVFAGRVVKLEKNE